MLKKFELRNYRNFRDSICIDFENTAGYQFNTDCISDGLISKMLIYGRNATGKTNLGRALIDILLMSSLPRTKYENFLNADSAEESVAFSYTFQFGESEVVYRYSRFSVNELQKEELLINGISIFCCDFENKQFDFNNLKYTGAETVKTERYLQSLEESEETEGVIEPKLPFLYWLIGNTALKKDSLLIRLFNYIRRMVIILTGNAMSSRTRKATENFYKYLEKPQNLGGLEDFLNEMGVECRLSLRQLPDGRDELYFVHEKLIPFYENASSGTLALVDLYNRLIPRVWDASFIYLDEFDAFYHYEMAENVVRFFKKRYPKSQIIMTTHNTNLMTNRLMRPDCVFILSQTGKLTPLCNATQRELREGHNLEKMYISGEFEQYE